MPQEYIITDYTVDFLKEIAKAEIKTEDLDEYTCAFVRGQKALAQRVLRQNDIEWEDSNAESH